MPKIATMPYRINGELVQVGIYYGRENGFYAKGLPEVVTRMDVSVRGHKTEDELLRAIQKAIYEYHEVIKSKRKVIVYKISLGTDTLMNRVTRGEWRGRKAAFANLTCTCPSFSTGKGFSFEWSVLWEVTQGERHYFGVEEDDSLGRSTYVGKEQLVIEWTPEREAGLIEIDNSLDRLAERVASILGRPETFTALLDNPGNAKLLEYK